MSTALLTYTPPEDRVIPATYDLSGWFELEGRDPWWRDALSWLGCKICSMADKCFSTDPKSEIGWRDHLRWMVEGWGGELIGVALKDSHAEERMIINSEIPWKYVNRAKRLRLIAKYPECFVAVDPEWLRLEEAEDREFEAEVREALS